MSQTPCRIEPSLADALDCWQSQGIAAVEALATPEHLAAWDRQWQGSDDVGLLDRAAALMTALRQAERAVDCRRRALVVAGDGPHALALARTFKWVGRLAEAEAVAREAVSSDRAQPDSWACWAQALLDLGDVPGALEAMAAACRLAPERADLLSRRLAMEHYRDDARRGQWLDEYQRLGRLIVQSRPFLARPVVTPDPDRRLRVGVLSPFFRANSVAYTFEPVLDGTIGADLEWVAYSLVDPAWEDDVTERLRGKVAAFHRVGHLETASLVRRIVDDRIDILMEIAGYVGGHRMDVLACRPAPVQVDLGAVDTTGLPTLDYRLTDRWWDPPEMPLPYTETSVRLPGGCQCYRPWGAVPVNDSPLLRSGRVQFGAFHDHRKISDTSLRLWVNVLDRVPGSTLWIKSRDCFDPEVRRRLRRRWGRAGGDEGRLRVTGWRPHGDHFEALHEVDLMLDTTPHSGSITTLEALWMGVPTVTLAGSMLVGRMGVLTLDRLGLGVFVAADERQYVDKAVSFAQQGESLAALRRGLRAAMLRSDVCRPARYGREVAAALRAMWVRWCRRQGGAVPEHEAEAWFAQGVAGSEPGKETR